MSIGEVEDIVVGTRERTRITTPLFEGEFAIVYSFPFSYSKRHQLIVIFDADERLIGIDSRNLSIDLW